MKGVNPAVGNAYNLSVTTTPDTWIRYDNNEPNDTATTATKVTAPHLTSMDLMTVEHPDCRTTLTLHSLTDVDYYAFTVKPEDFTEDLTGVCVWVRADLPITVQVSRDGTTLQTLSGETVYNEIKQAQPGNYLVKVSASTLNAYTMRTRVGAPGSYIRNYELEAWLKNVTQPQQPLPGPGGLPHPFPDWLRPFPWDDSVLFAMRANGVTPVPEDLDIQDLDMGTSPHFFTIGTAEAGPLNLNVGLLGGGPLRPLAPAENLGGLYAGLWDAEGNELWRVEDLQESTEFSTDLQPNYTYLLIISGSARDRASLTLDMPGAPPQATIAKVGDTVTVTWQPFGTGLYTVQYIEYLVRGAWQDAPGAWPSAATSVVFEPNDEPLRGRRGYFRVKSSE